MRHRGIASAMARYALEDLSRSRSEGQSEGRSEGRSQAKIGVYCGFVADYVQAHPDWKETVDINRSAFIATYTARDTTTRITTSGELS
jgi:predicted GNAT family acetyltransferase